MLRVLMLSTDLQRGGYPLRLARWALRLRDAEILPVVGCLAPPGPLSVELDDAGIDTFACDASGPRDLECLVRLAGLIRRIDPDIIHSALFHANIATRLVGRLDRPRPLITSTVTIEIERRWHLGIEALTGAVSSVHLANSSAVANHVCNDLGFRTSDVVVIPNGVDFDALDAVAPADRGEFGIPADAKLIVWAGRLDPVKNLDALVGIVGRIREHVPVRVLLLGDGPERSRLTRRIGRAGLAPFVSLAGWRNDVASWLKTSDVLLFPSLTEGSPNTVIEAMACGCPVVASDIPACRELIDNGVHGWLCPSADQRAYADAVRLVFEDRLERERRVSQARRRVQKTQNIQDVVAMLSRLYQQVASSLR